ncbi:hypothetical protein QN277_001293 [Acacia crassicarpa]|uniref:Serine carboxypeptidase-like 18 n=1 Tax=Acacia crassicarpa TaxID=499986 RepID=A0AAE1TI40_9FABA|nr:hypothetical protein QN277_001293 [Acacia crassicarpa]
MGFITSLIFITPKWLFLRLLLLLVPSANAAFSGEVVKYLPGYDGQLPFKLETGYVSVNHSELFYYFIESQGEPETDPLFFWFSGGPGCSSFNGLIYEIGPLQFDINHYDGGLPTLLNYPYSWTETASFVFVDSPVGTGFSYSTSSDWSTSDTLSAEQAQFVRKWLEEHSQYLHLRLFIGGDSYSGIIVPLITLKIVQGNDAGLKPHLNLTGYYAGSPVTDIYITKNSRFKFAHRLALISDQLYEKLKSSCKGDYVNVDANETACQTAIFQYEKNIEDIYTDNILLPDCAFDESRNLYHPLSLQRPSPKLSSDFWCWDFNHSLSNYWANDPSVQEALHVRKGKIKYWERCNETLSYTNDVETVVHVHQWLSHRKLQALVNNGDRDMTVPYVAAEEWLKILNLTVSSKWRPWFVDGQVAGYTRSYHEKATGYRLEYGTVKGAGHTAPEYSRKNCYEMFRRWIHYYPL